jgi:hypothetical protein
LLTEGEISEDDDIDDIDEDGEDDEEWESEAPVKDAKYRKTQANKAMWIVRKQKGELDTIKAAKDWGPKLTDKFVKELKDKYDEEDIETIQRLISKELENHETSKLAQKELNIFEKNHPELTTPELKHLQWMQKEFGYSLKKAYEVAFFKGEPKQGEPRDHSIRWSQWGDWTKVDDKVSGQEKEDKAAYDDMMKNYTSQ